MKTDLLIIGSGPAGLQAAIHASRKKIKVVVAGKVGNSSLKRAKVENYCCGELLSEGWELLEKGCMQSQNFGVIFKKEDIVKIEDKKNGFFYIELESGENFEAKAIIIATGVTKNTLNVKGENKYHGKGVSYCVECDAGFFKNKKVAVVGNGSAAAMGAILMEAYAKEVILIYKQLDISEKLKQRLDASSIVQVSSQWVKEIKGDEEKMTSCLLIDDKSIEVDGLFIERGAKSAVELFSALSVELDKETYSYIAANKKQETNVAGIFAAGDICGPPFQLAKAVGEGCVAGIFASDYVKSKEF
ncbi:MAG: FAD-dependent oxidoreductase [Candidatus Aureabacteria bacterium]|nr:FAD-dependent oxidoreductase [Candidatus Auribacterota bacterium]